MLSGLTDRTFIWDDEKHKANIRKHGISFDEATTVFNDEKAVYFYDESNSQDEDRFLIVGYSEFERILIVCHCYRLNDSQIRIVSARKATKTESKLYGGE